ncbi:unnamed protein product [Rhizopus stolonifer]
MTEGMEVDEVTVEFGDIEMLRENGYLVDNISQSAEDEKNGGNGFRAGGGATVPKAAEACGIPTSSAYKLKPVQ